MVASSNVLLQKSFCQMSTNQHHHHLPYTKEKKRTKTETGFWNDNCLRLANTKFHIRPSLKNNNFQIIPYKFLYLKTSLTFLGDATCIIC